MAGNYNHTSGTATNTSDLIAKLDTFVVARGWSQLYHSGTTYIWTSNGELSNEKIFIEMSVSGSSLNSRIARYATEGGSVSSTVPTNASGFITSSTSSHLYWFFGDKDRIAVVTKIATTYYFGSFGVLDSVWSREFAVSSNAESAGSNVVIEVDTTDPFTVGEYYQIVNDNDSNGNYEPVLVTEIVAGVSITVASLAANHPAGALIGEDPRPNYATRGSPYTTAHMHTIAGAAADASAEGFSVLSGYMAPENRKGLYLLFPRLVYVNISEAYDLRGKFKEIYRCGATNIASEDTITTVDTVYRVFNTSIWGWMAIKESEVV